MNISHTIKLCSDLADLKIPQRFLYTEAEALQDERVQRLILCCNVVMDKLYTEHFVCIGRTNVTVTNNFLDVSSLNLCKVISLTDCFGNNAKFRYTQGGLFAEDGNYLLTYGKLSQKLLWDDEIVYPSPRVTDRIFAYGVLAEYFLAVGDFAVSELWRQKFDDALQAATHKTSCGRMPVGRWE